MKRHQSTHEAGDYGNLITDGSCTTPILSEVLQIPTANEEWLCSDGEEFQLHQISNYPLLLRWNVWILMGTVRNAKNRRLSSSSTHKEIFSCVHIWKKSLWPHRAEKYLPVTTKRPSDMGKERISSLNKHNQRSANNCRKWRSKKDLKVHHH